MPACGPTRRSAPGTVAATPDANLLRAQQELVGHNVYAYGQLGLSCAPRWTRVYGPRVPLHIVAIEREQRGATLGTGAQYGLAAYGPSFDVARPLRIVFALPKRPPTGTNFVVGGIPGPCPAIDLADFQVPLAFSLSPPPLRALDGGLRVGMTRTDLIWHVGYPWELGDRKKLLGEDVWIYGFGPTRYDVKFHRDRVVSLEGHPPGL
jgi:hypothetical protein